MKALCEALLTRTGRIAIGESGHSVRRPGKPSPPPATSRWRESWPSSWSISRNPPRCPCPATPSGRSPCRAGCSRRTSSAMCPSSNPRSHVLQGGPQEPVGMRARLPRPSATPPVHRADAVVDPAHAAAEDDPHGRHRWHGGSWADQRIAAPGGRDPRESRCGGHRRHRDATGGPDAGEGPTRRGGGPAAPGTHGRGGHRGGRPLGHATRSRRPRATSPIARCSSPRSISGSSSTSWPTTALYYPIRDMVKTLRKARLVTR